jgi:hypothetical protein
MSETSEMFSPPTCGTTPTITCLRESGDFPWASPGRACLPAFACSPEDFPARTSPTRGDEQGSRASAVDSGERWYALFAVYDPTMCSWRTLQRCLDGEWEPFSGIWPKAGTMWNGVCSMQVTWERRTGERGSFLWPTPLAAPPRHRLGELVGAGQAPLSPEKRWFNRRTGKSVQKGLEQVVQVYARQQTSTAGRRRGRRRDRWLGTGETTHQGDGWAEYPHGWNLWWAAQSGLGRGPHGLPSWLDSTCWPTRPGEPQHAWEPPRLVSGQVPQRSTRLRMLGNSIVPQLVAAIGRGLLLHSEQRSRYVLSSLFAT